MKDTIITASRKKRELMILILCFIFAFFLNLYSILKFNNPLKELFTQLHVVVMIMLFLYGVLLILRIIWWLLAKLYKRIVRS